MDGAERVRHERRGTSAARRGLRGSTITARRDGRWLSVLGWLVCLQPAGYSRAGAQAPPTLPQVLDVALHRNPDILQARLRVDSAHGERRIAGALPNPTYFGIPGNPYQYSVALPIDLTP